VTSLLTRARIGGLLAKLTTPDRAILQYGYGLTAVVERATAWADQLSVEEFVAAAGCFERKIEDYAPRFLAFLGKAVYVA
jgi:TDG/mug DNA glycosylase family protein